MFEDFSEYEDLIAEADSNQAFLDGQLAVYFSDTSEYFDIQNSMGGSYVMVPLALEQIICQPCNCWSISYDSAEQEIAAESILEVFMENNAERIYYVQNNVTDPTSIHQANTGFPVEKGAVSAYMDVRPKFRDILNNFEAYVFEEQ